MKRITHTTLTLLAIALLTGMATVPLGAQTKVTSPEEQFGSIIGADYVLFTYTQLTAYWQKLDRERPIGDKSEISLFSFDRI